MPEDGNAWSGSDDAEAQCFLGKHGSTFRRTKGQATSASSFSVTCSDVQTPEGSPPTVFCKRHSRLIALALLLLAAVTVCRTAWVGPSSTLAWYGGRISFSLYLYFTPYYRGRKEAADPSPRCCHGTGCLPLRGTGRYAVVTMLRTDQYLGLTQALACSLRASNPGLPLIVITVKGDLAAETLEAVSEIARLQFVEEFYIQNHNAPRFGYNWSKFRGWELEEWDGLLMLDSDMMVDSDIRFLFDLPTDYATVLDADKLRAWPKFSPMGISQGGVLFFRPCAAVAAHMMALARDNYFLQYRYHDAEQTFLDWYFKYTRWTLPQEYNSLVGPAHTFTSASGHVVTHGGATPVIRHFSGREKPWQANLQQCEAGLAPP